MDEKLKEYTKKYAKTFTLIGAGLSGILGAFMVYNRFTENPEHLSNLGNAFDCGWRYAATVACTTAVGAVDGCLAGFLFYRIECFTGKLEEKINSIKN
ncbi:hypothetical protein HZA97_05880 [Candidatus Woesearchaeota archaeon]|nr:hypothetical protein [Candidatus Woesearchaeota archaeon]